MYIKRLNLRPFGYLAVILHLNLDVIKETWNPGISLLCSLKAGKLEKDISAELPLSNS